ncbi:MAG TPA: DNA translocase FtsK 4TM domain-containing protein, partial [Elusimicrobiota bacterium]|nr:DNA translocase FtsK 4TM domain-containing protein [Elusimicrobiota bacterium]
LLGYRGIRLLFHREERRPWRYLLVDALLVLAFCAVLTSFGLIFLDINPGGMTGRLFADLLSQLFGRGGALFVSASILGALSLWRSGKRPGELLRWFGERLLQDWREWRDAVAVEKSKRGESSRKKSFPKVAPSIDAGANGRGHEIEPPIVRLRPEKPVAPAVYAPPVVPAKAVKRGEAQLAEAAAGNGEAARMEPFRSPGLDLLKASDGRPHVEKEADLLASAQLLEKTLADFGVQGKVVEIHPGPIITRFDYSPAPGTKVQSVATLSNDIALAMRAMSVRIVAPIPGKAAVGIELPNPHRAVVRLREVFECADYQNHKSKLALGLGKDAEGHPVVGDMATMPHLLIAGSTGSGKSVCIHSLVMSLMFRSTPDEVKLLMIDPKRLELPLYNGIPYLYDPNQNPDNVRVITDSKEAAKALEGMIKVMDHRFKKFASVMARDIMHYNEKMAAEGRPAEPFIVIIIDELADLMAVAPKEVEGSIQRLTQMARAVGIHMVLATQRPSVDVITGVIKANLPARIAFRVSSQTDSRVILDTSGAESLLGQGDMLFLPPGAPKPARLQCGLVTSQEVQTIADFVRAQGKPAYERILSPVAGAGTPGDPAATEELDDLQQALMLVLERRRVSQDLLKAHFGSSATATDLLSLLEVKGFISKPEGTNRWTIFYDRIDAYLGQLKNQAPSA